MEMKKTYMQPATEWFDMVEEEMICNSPTIEVTSKDTAKTLNSMDSKTINFADDTEW